MKKLGFMLICVLVLPIMASQKSKTLSFGCRTSQKSKTLGSGFGCKDRLMQLAKRIFSEKRNKKRKSIGNIEKLSDYMGQDLNLNALSFLMEESQQLLPEAKSVIRALPICPTGIDAMVCHSNLEYDFLKVVAETYLENSAPLKEANKEQFLRVTDALKVIKEFLKRKSHFNIAHITEKGKSTETYFDSLAKERLSAFRKLMHLRASIAEQQQLLKDMPSKGLNLSVGGKINKSTPV